LPASFVPLIECPPLHPRGWPGDDVAQPARHVLRRSLRSPQQGCGYPRTRGREPAATSPR